MSAQDPFCWDGSSSAVPLGAVEPAHARPPRGRGRAIAAALVVAAGGAAAAVIALGGGGGGAGPGGVTEMPLASAAAVTEQAQGFKLSMSVKVTVGADTLRLTASGWFNLHPLEGSLTLTAGDEQLRELLVPPDLYTLTPDGDGLWTQTAVGDAPSSAANGSLAPQPTEQLGLLRSLGSVAEVGGRSLDGVSTTEYRAVLEASRLSTLLPSTSRAAWVADVDSAGLSTIPIEVWVDGEGRVRQLAVETSLSTSQGTASVAMSARYSDFGPQPLVSAPPADRIAAAAPLAES